MALRVFLLTALTLLLTAVVVGAPVGILMGVDDLIRGRKLTRGHVAFLFAAALLLLLVMIFWVGEYRWEP